MRTMAQFQAGTATIALDNRGREFDPLNTASPYYPNITPETLIQIEATWSGVTYPIWTGYADEWPVSWPGFGVESEVQVKATDIFKQATVKKMLTTNYANAVMALSPWIYLPMDDPAGSEYALDQSGANYIPNAQAYGCTFGYKPGYSNVSDLSAVDLSPSGYLIAPQNPQIGGGSGWTFIMWMKTAMIPGAGGAAIASWNGGGDLLNSGLTLESSGILEGFIGGVGISASPVVNDGKWHMVGIQYSSAPEMVLIVDGNVYGAVGSAGVQFPGQMMIGMGKWSPSFVGQVAQVSAFNQFLTPTQIASLYAAATPFPQQTTGQRISAALSIMGVPSALQAIDTGETTLAAENQSLSTVRALEYIQQVEQSEQGQLFTGPDGVMNFYDRYHRFRYPNYSSQATFSDDGTGLPYTVGGFAPNINDQQLYNIIAVTRRGGTMQVASDQTSITDNGERTPTGGLTDLQYTNDTDSLGCAGWILADTATAKVELPKLILDPTGNDSLWPQVLARRVGDVITIKKTQIPGGGSPISIDCRIEGIKHTIGNLKWQTEWSLSTMGLQKWLIFDDPVLGFWDNGALFGW